jgi:hypothetical protein
MEVTVRLAEAAARREEQCGKIEVSTVWAKGKV